MMAETKSAGERTLDTRGLRCPLPVIRMEAVLRSLPAGENLIVVADDPIARVDLPFSAKNAGYECEEMPSQSQEVCVFKVTRGQEA